MNSALLLFQIILLVFTCVMSLFQDSFSDSYILLCLSIVVVSTVAFSLKSENTSVFLKKNKFTITLLFLIGFIIVHFQAYLEYLLGNVKDLGFTYRLDYDIVPKAITISVIALISFYIGYMIELMRNNKFHDINQQTQEEDYPHYRTTLLEVIAFVCLFVFFFSIDRAYFHGGHVFMKNNGGIGPITSYAQMFLNYCVIATIIIQGWNYRCSMNKKSLMGYIRQYNVLFLITVAVYCILVLLSGNRGPVIKICIIAFASFVFSAKYYIGGIKIVLISAVAAVCLFLLGLFRSTYEMDDMSTRVEAVSSLVDMQMGNMWLCPITKEFAVIVRTYNSMVMYVSENGINYGIGMIYNLMGAIPGLGYVFTTISDIPQESIVSAEIVTDYMQSDHGMGTTCVADVYLGLGSIGIVPIFLLFGIFLRYLDYRSGAEGKMSLLCWVSILIFIAFAITIGRGTLTILFREVSYTFITILLLKLGNRIIFE